MSIFYQNYLYSERWTVLRSHKFYSFSAQSSTTTHKLLSLIIFIPLIQTKVIVKKNENQGIKAHDPVEIS